LLLKSDSREENMKLLRISLVVALIVGFGRAFNANALTETNLYSFGSITNDGARPYSGLVQGSDGNFYGTTLVGGASGSGTVFRISATGSYSNLYSFDNLPDGQQPFTGLVQGSDSNFYGTTQYGGASGNGTVFRISATGTYSNLYSFANSPDGRRPFAALVQGCDGNFYGTTLVGGASGSGTVFRISPAGSYSNLHSFGSIANDGATPQAGLVQGNDGNLYGTDAGGGAHNIGTVFWISATGGYSNLYSFGSITNDGAYPLACLAQDGDGNFFGTTAYGGGTNFLGTVFRISSTGSYSNLYSFQRDNDGANPQAALVHGSDGNFYGMTPAGTVFRISPAGNYSNLYRFGGIAIPQAGLVQGSDGNFYGTTSYGGTHGGGTVFKLTVPLNPLANEISQIQLSGPHIIFSIPSVAGETYQLQFSSSMQPTNWVNVPGVSLTNSIGALLTLTNSGGAVGPQGFYRFDIIP
jgi:uncharacterized repeat protein (TIGR03803 family)